MSEEEIIFKPDTVVRIKATNEFGQIKKRCWCGGQNTPLHYEVWIEGKKGDLVVAVFDHDMLEFECPPKNELKEAGDQPTSL